MKTISKLVLFLALVSYSSSQEIQCEQKKDQKFNGVKIIDLFAPSVDFCCMECSNYATCNAWNYENTSGQCELMSEVKGEPESALNSNLYI